jgi:glycosyltransferase involved in cell wall biosynthesis
MNSVKLSVCIPVYNCDQYIGEAIESVLNQSFTDLELVIVDNKSTDRTVEVIRKYKDPRIRLIQNESNIGMLANWNKSVNEAKGEYIKVLPADDFLYPGCLEKQCAVLDQDKDHKIALVTGRKKIIDDKGKTLFTRGISRSTKILSGSAAINRTVRSGGNIIGEPGVVMFRKEIVSKTGPFVADIYYVMDLSLWFKMLLHGSLFSLPDAACAFRISGVSESIKQIATQKRDIDAFFTNVFKDKRYGLTSLSFRIGLLNSFISAQLRKLIYKFVIR